jgi:hypothetical protein
MMAIYRNFTFGIYLWHFPKLSNLRVMPQSHLVPFALQKATNSRLQDQSPFPSHHDVVHF